MAHARLGPLLALVFVFAAGVTGCKKPKGSCDRRGDESEKTCKEILASTIKDMSKASCADDPTSHAKGTWSEGPCAHDDALAGCESSLSRTWYYRGGYDGRMTKVEHAAFMCDGVGTLVDAKGKKLTGVKPEKLPGEPKDRELEALVATPNPKLTAILDGMRKVKLPSGAPSGVIRPSDGKLDAPTATIWEPGLEAFGIDAKHDNEPFVMKQEDGLEACDLAVRSKKRMKNWSIDDIKRALAWCPTVEYLLVVRVVKYEQAEQTNSDWFKGGKVEGHVFAFELPSAKAIGGYSFRTESSAKVKSNELDRDLRDNLEKALNVGLKRANPAGNVTFDL